MKKQISFTACLFLCFWNASAQGGSAVAAQDSISSRNSRPVPYNIFEQLRASDSNTAAVSFHQDKKIEQLFIERQMQNSGAAGRFRVQVFSSNEQKTAKAEAFRIKDLVQKEFPDLGVYESYSSPFWKVRVGDFYTREEAQVLLNDLMLAFPDIRREMYIVSDEIKVPNSK